MITVIVVRGSTLEGMMRGGMERGRLWCGKDKTLE